ncbi:MAG TPA: sigma-70 family RNA polymerase sigma factor, partial [Capillimicrobium sp.]
MDGSATGMEAAALTRELTDEQLVAATRAGDDRAFELLYARYQRRVSAYVVGMVKDHQRAEDVTQEVFISALRRMRQTDREIAFKPWVYEIAKNACIDQFRRTSRTDEVSCDAEEGVGPTLVSHGPTPDMALQSKQQLDDLRGAFSGLSDAHHRILVMRELEGLSYAEIGERLGMSKPSVESTLFRARKRLSEEYDELVSGERCLRVQGIIMRAESGRLGARDQRRMARHVSYCQPCRRAAAMAGLGDLVPRRTGVRAKIAGFLPLPVALRDRWLGIGGQGAAQHGDGAGGGLVAWAHALLPAADSGGAVWAKAVATAATVAVAGLGANAAIEDGDSERATTAGAAPVRSEPVSARAASAGARGPAAAKAATARRGGPPAAGEAGSRAGAGAGARGSGGSQARRDSGAAAVTLRPGAPRDRGADSARGAATLLGATANGGPGQGGSGGGDAGGSQGSSGDGGGGSAGGGGAGQAVTSTVSAAAPGAAKPAGSTPGAPVVDTEPTVPTLPEVTQAVGQTVQSTTQAVGQTVQATTQAAGQTLQSTTQAAGQTV